MIWYGYPFEGMVFQYLEHQIYILVLPIRRNEPAKTPRFLPKSVIVNPHGQECSSRHKPQYNPLDTRADQVYDV